MTALTRQRQEALQRAGGLDAARALAEQRAAHERLSRARDTAAGEKDLAVQLQAHDAHQEAATAGLAALREDAASAAGALDAERRALRADQERLDSALAAGSDPQAQTIAELRRSLAADADRQEASARALAGARAALEAVGTAAADLSAALAEEGFADADEVDRARMDAAGLHALQERVRHDALERARVERELGEERIAALTGDEDADVEAARARQAAAETAWSQAVEDRSAMQSRLGAFETACTGLERAIEDLTTAVGASAALIEVASLASGVNRDSTPLATWVLLERFIEVLAFANQRLGQMSNGRFELVPVDDEKQSARKRGLGLGVIDHLWGGAHRDPKTLSGGETFYVSLSLALALADVVATESGGITMDTLFIDEGFGSLDPDTLQTVMAELGRLQASGRTVGIVSHVEELRRQVPDQIRVVTGPEGSSLSITAG